MQAINSPLTFSIADSLKDISQEDWDSLFGRELIESYGYQKTLEESGLKEFSFRYLLARRSYSLSAIIPFFVTEFALTTLIDGNLHRIANKFNAYSRLKLLFIGSITTEELYFGVSKNEDFRSLMDGVIEKISEMCKQEKISGMIFYNLSESNKELMDYLKEKGYIEMEGLPGTIIEIGSPSIEEYINTLSRNTRKDLKKKLRHSSAQAQLTTVVRQDVDDIIDDIYKLYMNNFDESSVHFEVLSPEFFRRIPKNMPGEVKFFITYDKKKIVAFNLCLVKGNLCIDKFIGLDNEVALKYHLYFTTLYHNLDWCIKNGIKFYQPGATDYHPKMRYGARLIPLYVYSKAFNPLLDCFVRTIARFIQPKNLDSSYKLIENPEDKIFRQG